MAGTGICSMSVHTPLVVGAFTRKIRGVPQARPIGRSTAALSCKFAVALQGDITQHVGMEAQPGLGQDGFDFGYGGVGMLHTHSCILLNSSALNASQVGAIASGAVSCAIPHIIDSEGKAVAKRADALGSSV